MTSFIEGLYEDYLADPASVPEAWRSYFDALQTTSRRALMRRRIAPSSEPLQPCRNAALSALFIHEADLERKQVRVLQLINAHRFLGVRVANLDPLHRHGKPVVPNSIRHIMALAKPIWIPLSRPVRWWAGRA